MIVVTCVLIQTDSKKIQIARPRLYEGDGVVGRGTETKGGEDVKDVKCEDVTHTLLHTHTHPLTQKRLTHRRLYIHKLLFYTQKFLTHMPFCTQMLLHTDTFDTHKHVLTHTSSHKRFF